MSVIVQLPTALQDTTGGEQTLCVDSGSVMQVLEDLDERYPGIRDRLIDGGRLRRFVHIYVRDEDIRYTGGLDTLVTDGDEISILSAIAGG